jgi:two-component system NtrC family sensor kinase
MHINERDKSSGGMERILIIEDNVAIARMLAESWLPTLGYTARAVQSYGEGRAALTAQSTDLVLLDLQLPDGAGLEHLAAIRREFPDVAVILMNKPGAERDAVEAFRLGARNYLLKPFSADQLRLAVEQALRERRLQHEKEALSAGMQQRVQELTVLNAIGRSLTTVSEIEPLLTQIVESAIALTQADEAFLLLPDAHSAQLHVRASRTIGDERTQLLHIPVQDSIIGQVLTTRRPLRLTRPPTAHPVKLRTGYLVRALLLAPLLNRGQAIGILGVDNVTNPAAFTEAQERLLAALADYAAIALENARLLQTSQRSEARYRELFTHASDLFIVLDRELRIVEINAAGPRLLGYSYVELVGQKLERLLSPAQWTRIASQLQRQLNTDQTLASCELELHKRGGAGLTVELSARRVLDGNGQHVLFCSARDLTERRLLQAQATHAEKLAALEQVVAGVAHELNNPLASITGYTQLLLRDARLSAEARQDMERVLSQAQRAGEIVRDLLNFGRGSQLIRTAVHLTALLTSTLELQTMQTWPASITIVRELRQDLPTVAADPYQIQRVVLNLLDNARRAMRESGGTLTVRNYLVSDAEELQAQAGRSGPCAPAPPEVCEPLVVVEISDTGIGIPAQQLRSIFDPFWTTKPVGEGPGLGLSACYGIIAQHRGHIWACSVEGEGTSVYIALPPRSKTRDDES